MGQVELSFIIPAYNEEFFIENTLGTIDLVVKDEELEYEVVVVDDGSRDKTFSNATRYAQRNGHVKVIGYPKNRGKGYAIKTGFMKSIGDIVLFVDGDMEIDLNTILKFIRALENADLVIASKWHPQSQISMSVRRRIMSRTFNLLARLLIGFDLKDTQVGLKVMRRSAVNEIFPKLAVKRYAFDVELLAVSRLHNLRIVEMPVKLDLKASFKVQEAWRMFVDLLGIAYRLRVTHWYHRRFQNISNVNRCG